MQARVCAARSRVKEEEMKLVLGFAAVAAPPRAVSWDV